MSREDDIRKLIKIHDQRRQILREQQALYGPKVDPGVIIEIKQIEDEIEKLQTELGETIVQLSTSPSRVENYQDNTTQPDTDASRPMESKNIDFVIITPLEEERDAILAKLPNYEKLPPTKEDVRVYFQSDLATTSGGGSYRIIVMPLLGMGRVLAATATNDAIRRWNPRYVILVGIAGGVAEKGVKLGDVLVPDKIVDYELQKQTAEGPDIRWEVYNVSSRLLGAAKNFIDKSWLELIDVKRPRRGQSKRHIGPIASGDKVIDFAETLKKYRETWSKLVGVEMEAGGVALSAFQTEQQAEFFMIRGVSDLADGEKNDPKVKRWRAYACDVAASYTIALLRDGPIPLTTISEEHIPRKSEEELFKASPKPEYRTIWQNETFLKPKHFFANSNYLCVISDEALNFFSANNGESLLPPLTNLGKFSLTEYTPIGGAAIASDQFLLTLLPPPSDKARLLALKLTGQNTAQSREISEQWVYEAPGTQLSAPIIHNEAIYLIQRGPELVELDLERGRQRGTIRLPKVGDIHRDCVSFTFAANRLCLALCNGTILALDPQTGQTLGTLYEDPQGRRLSPLATDGLNLFFGTYVKGRPPSPSHVYTIDAVSGEEIWKFELPPDSSGQYQPVVGQPLVVNDILYVTGRNHYLHALDIHTGQELWQQTMPGRIELGPIWTGEALIVVDRNGNMQALRGGPVFRVTCHYDPKTVPVLGKWNPLSFTLINTGKHPARNTILRIKGDFMGRSDNQTQHLYVVAPNGQKNCSVWLKPTASGEVYMALTIDYRYPDGSPCNEKFDLFIPVRGSSPGK